MRDKIMAWVVALLSMVFIGGALLAVGLAGLTAVL